MFLLNIVRIQVSVTLMFIETSAVPHEYAKQRRNKGLSIIIGRSYTDLFNPSSPDLCGNFKLTGDPFNSQAALVTKYGINAETVESNDVTPTPQTEQENKAVSSVYVTVPFRSVALEGHTTHKRMTAEESYSATELSFVLARESKDVATKPSDQRNLSLARNTKDNLTSSADEEQDEQDEDEYYKIMLRAIRNQHAVADDDDREATEYDRERREEELKTEEYQQAYVEDSTPSDFERLEENTSEIEYHVEKFHRLRKDENQDEESVHAEDVASSVSDLREKDATEKTHGKVKAHTNDGSTTQEWVTESIRVTDTRAASDTTDQTLTEYVVNMDTSSHSTDATDFGQGQTRDKANSNTGRTSGNGGDRSNNRSEIVNYFDYHQEEQHAEYDQVPVDYLMINSGQHNKYKRKSGFSIKDILTNLSTFDDRKRFTTADYNGDLGPTQAPRAVRERASLKKTSTPNYDIYYDEHASTEDQSVNNQNTPSKSGKENNLVEHNSGVRLLRLLKLFSLGG